MYSDRVGIDDVEPYFGQKRDRLQGAQPDQLLVAGLKREGVEDTVELARVHGVELRVEKQLPKAVAREPGPLDESLQRRTVGVVGLEVEKSEDGDRVVMEDPEVLGSEEGCHLRRW